MVGLIEPLFIYVECIFMRVNNLSTLKALSTLKVLAKFH